MVWYSVYVFLPSTILLDITLRFSGVDGLIFGKV